MYLIYNLARYSVKVNDETKLLEIEKSKDPVPYPEAAELAIRRARSDSEKYGRQTSFRPEGKRIGEAAD